MKRSGVYRYVIVRYVSGKEAGRTDFIDTIAEARAEFKMLETEAKAMLKLSNWYAETETYQIKRIYRDGKEETVFRTR